MRFALSLLLLPLALRAQSPANQAFDHLAAQHVLDRARAHPEWGTSVGLHTLDSRLDDRSARAMAVDSMRAVLGRAALAKIDSSKLDARRRVDWLLLDAVLETSEHDAGLRRWERRPGDYVPFDAIYTLAVGTEPSAAQRATAITRRLEQWPAAMALGRRQIVAARAPRLWVEMDVASARGIRRYLDGDLTAAMKSLGGDSPRFRAARDAAGAALDGYTSWMRDTLLPNATGDWREGAAGYDWRLAHAKLLPYTAESLISLGHEVLAETERDLVALTARVAPGRTWRQLADSARGLHPARDSVFAAYSAAAARARAFVVRKKLFTLPAGERLQMVLTPPNLRQTYAYGGYDAPAPFEAEQVGRFFVTPVDTTASAAEQESKLRGFNYGWITVVSAHEGYPGHHLQYVSAARQPSILRKVYGSETFSAGWALYGEELMYRNGYYADSLARLTQLRMRLWRAARVIVDPSIHTGRMTFDQAVQFMVDSVGLERQDAVAEVNRYTTWPTQAVSYIVGNREIDALRDEVKRREGAAFDLSKFHATLLKQGSLAPVLMRRAVLKGEK
jgi:uncharacterized protein (DUF885 family)